MLAPIASDDENIALKQDRSHGSPAETIPQYGVRLYVYSGAVTPKEMLSYVPTFKPGRQIHYFDRSVDLSGLDVASIPVLRRMSSAKLSEVSKDEPLFAAIVTAAPEAQQFLHVWCS